MELSEAKQYEKEIIQEIEKEDNVKVLEIDFFLINKKDVMIQMTWQIPENEAHFYPLIGNIKKVYFKEHQVEIFCSWCEFAALREITLKKHGIAV